MNCPLWHFEVGFHSSKVPTVFQKTFCRGLQGCPHVAGGLNFLQVQVNQEMCGLAIFIHNSSSKWLTLSVLGVNSAATKWSRVTTVNFWETEGLRRMSEFWWASLFVDLRNGPPVESQPRFRETIRIYASLCRICQNKIQQSRGWLFLHLDSSSDSLGQTWITTRNWVCLGQQVSFCTE